MFQGWPKPIGSAVPFRLHACAHATAVLDGELDLTSLDLFLLALRRTALRPIGGELVIDATKLGFLDYRSLLALADHAQHSNAKVVLQTGLPGIAQMIEILDFKDMRVEVPT